MKKIFLPIVCILSLILVSCAGISANASNPKNENKLVILHTNDHHGHPLAFYDYPCPDQGGLPARATFIKSVRDEYSNVLVLDAGDINTGRAESNFFDAQPDIIGYNYIGYDAMAVGNHEFDPSPAKMQKQIKSSKFPWLCANISKDGKPLAGIEPYIIKNVNGTKVAILGLIDPNTYMTGNPQNIKDIEFADPVETAKKLVPILKTKADIIVALVHLGTYNPFFTKEKATGSVLLAQEVNDIDLIIDGHSHTKMKEPLEIENKYSKKKIPIVQVGCWGLYVGKAILTLDEQKKISSMNWEPCPINVQYVEKKDGKKITLYAGEKIEKDPVLLKKLSKYKEKVDAFLSKKIGVAKETFSNKESREKETALANMVCDGQMWYLNSIGIKNVHFFFQNGGGIRTTLGKGDIQKSTIYEILPFDNTIVTLKIKGEDLLKFFEQAATNIGKGAMPQISKEVNLVINSGKLVSATIDGNEIHAERFYTIATNSYIAAGGDGYSILKEKGFDNYDTSVMQRDAIIEYISAQKEIIPKTDNRIKTN